MSKHRRYTVNLSNDVFCHTLQYLEFPEACVVRGVSILWNHTIDAIFQRQRTLESCESKMCARSFMRHITYRGTRRGIVPLLYIPQCLDKMQQCLCNENERSKTIVSVRLYDLPDKSKPVVIRIHVQWGKRWAGRGRLAHVAIARLNFYCLNKRMVHLKGEIYRCFDDMFFIRVKTDNRSMSTQILLKQACGSPRHGLAAMFAKLLQHSYWPEFPACDMEHQNKKPHWNRGRWISEDTSGPPLEYNAVQTYRSMSVRTPVEYNLLRHRAIALILGE